MKSAIRIAYDNLAAVVDRDNELLAQWQLSLKNTNNGVPTYGYHQQPQTPEEEIRQAMQYQHIRQVIAGHELQISHAQERLDIAKRLYEEEYLPQLEERHQTLLTLFKMLTQEEQDEIMLNKLAR